MHHFDLENFRLGLPATQRVILCYKEQPGKETTDLNRLVHRFHPANVWNNLKRSEAVELLERRFLFEKPFNTRKRLTLKTVVIVMPDSMPLDYRNHQDTGLHISVHYCTI
jgi:hypothetical protein